MRISSTLRSLRSTWLGRPTDPGRHFLYVRMVVFAASVPLLTRLPLSWLERVLESGLNFEDVDRKETQDVTDLLDRVLRLPPPLVRTGCLTRGLLGYRFLRWAGSPVSLVFGIGHVDGEIGVSGHCWLELDGEPVRERRDPRPTFAETYRIPFDGSPAADSGLPDQETSSCTSSR